MHQAVVLTHTGVIAAEMEPYLASRLRPLTPVVLYGREGQAEPVCHPMECVYYGWRTVSNLTQCQSLTMCAFFPPAKFRSDLLPVCVGVCFLS